MSEGFDQFCLVELFGHQRIAGKVTEQVIAGTGFIRVDVMRVGDQPEYTKMFGPSAIYSITPVNEETCLALVKALREPPVSPWILDRPALPAYPRGETDDDVESGGAGDGSD